MKIKNLLLYLVYSSLILSFINANSQSLSITNVSGSNSSATGININSGQSISLSVTVQIDNPGFDGNLNLFSTRSSGAFPIEKSISIFIFGFNSRNVTDHSFDITLNSSDFNATGGQLYAEFENQAGARRRSSGVPVKVIPRPVSSPNPVTNSTPRPSSSVTSLECSNTRLFNGILSSDQIVSNGDIPEPIRTFAPRFGNSTTDSPCRGKVSRYEYQWYSALWERGTYTKIGNKLDGATVNSNSASFIPGPVSVTRYYRREVKAIFSDGRSIQFPTSRSVKVEHRRIDFTTFPSPLRNNDPTLTVSTNFKRDRRVKIVLTSGRVFFGSTSVTIFEGIVKAGKRAAVIWNVDRNIIRQEATSTLTIVSITDLDTGRSISSRGISVNR